MVVMVVSPVDFNKKVKHSPPLNDAEEIFKEWNEYITTEGEELDNIGD